MARTELEREARTRGESATPMLIGEVQQMKIRLQELQAESHQATQAKEAEIYALQVWHRADVVVIVGRVIYFFWGGGGCCWRHPFQREAAVR